MARNGSLHERNDAGRKPSWVLRFRVRCTETKAVRQRSISLGKSPELYRLVTQLLDTRDRIRSDHRAMSDAIRLDHRRCRQMTQELLSRIHGSGRYRRAVAQAFRVYYEASPAPSVRGFMPALDKPPLKRQRRGRPCKQRLW